MQTRVKITCQLTIRHKSLLGVDLQLVIETKSQRLPYRRIMQGPADNAGSGLNGTKLSLFGMNADQIKWQEYRRKRLN
jgi:hypothetical protein